MRKAKRPEGRRLSRKLGKKGVRGDGGGGQKKRKIKEELGEDKRKTCKNTGAGGAKRQRNRWKRRK